MSHARITQHVPLLSTLWLNVSLPLPRAGDTTADLAPDSDLHCRQPHVAVTITAITTAITAAITAAIITAVNATTANNVATIAIVVVDLRRHRRRRPTPQPRSL